MDRFSLHSIDDAIPSTMVLLDTEETGRKGQVDLVLDQSVLRNICLIIAVVLTLFGANNLSTGFQVLGVIDFVLAAGMLASAVRLFYSQPTLTLVLATLTAGALAVLMAIYSNAFGIYWSYVIAVASFLVVNKRTALIFNAIFILIAAPLTIDTLGAATSVRLAITLSLLTAFAYIFSSRIEERTKALLANVEDLDRASAVKSEFIANMSHEMRTPLTAVLGYAEVLSADNSLAAKDQEKLEAIIFGSRHLASLIEDVLELSRAEKSQLEVCPEPANLKELLENFVKLLEPQAQAKGLSLALTLRESLPTYVTTDPRRLKQILMNLAGNAIKFTEAGSVELDVDYKKDASELTITVSDTGIGVPEEFRPTLFEKFSQADSGMSREHGGAGLGLFISRSLAMLLGGDIEYIPQANGSAFKLTIGAEPCPDETEKETERSPAVLHDAQQFSGHVLIAEDSPANQMLIGVIVEKFGLSHDKVSNGQEAVEALQKERYDLILMDLQMPVMSGIEATQAIREFDQELPIIALSADVLRHDLQSTEMAGFTGFLAKPVDVEKMRSMFSEILPSPTETSF
ncbi:response regulator [Congregibacter sp.]|uniref:response regulator n=1 Tax=Congregibacter sp. TaxID=2744308 RepID=UPI003F6D23B1